MTLPPMHAGRILIADDVRRNRDLLEAALSSLGFKTIAVPDGQAALEVLAGQQFDLVILDVMMPRLDGYATCRRIKSDPATRFIPVVLLTGLSELEDRIAGIDAGADEFLSKPFNIHELRARARALIRLKRSTDELESAEAVVMSLAATIEARDAGTQGHCQRLAAYATVFGADLALSEGHCAALHRGGFLHDIGKIAIPTQSSSSAASLIPLSMR